MVAQPDNDVLDIVVALHTYEANDDNQLSFFAKDKMELINNE